jgi:hypothetical protein
MSGQESLKILCLGTYPDTLSMSAWQLLNLSLSDGGDARCMAQLYIIGEYIHRLEYKLGRKVLPCEHFDLIAAVDSSRQVIYGSNLAFKSDLC